MTTATATKPRTAPYQARCAELERELRNARTTGQRAIAEVGELKAELGRLDDLTPRDMAARIVELEDEAERVDKEHAEELEAAERISAILLEPAAALVAAIDAGKVTVDPAYAIEVRDLRGALLEANA